MKDEQLYIIHMIECAEKILSYTLAGRNAFMEDGKTQDAVMRNFEIMGEAAKRIDDTTKQKLPEIPWKNIAGFRDVLIHQYEGVDIAAVWKTIEKELPMVLALLKKLRK